MAKRTQRQEEDEDATDTGEVEQGDELSQLLAELDSSGAVTIKVERMREGKRPEYVGDMSPAGFTLAQLQERFGGGEYALTVFDSARRYVKRSTVAVASPFKPAAAVAPEIGGLEKFTQAITAQLQQQGQLLQLLLMQGRAPAAVTTADPQSMRHQLLEEMQLMKGIIGNGGGGVGPDKVLELLMKGMEIAKETGSGGKDWTDVAGKAIDVLGEPLAQLMQTAAIAQPHAQAPGAPRLAPTSQPQPKVNPMQQYLDFLVKKAAAGSDPVLYADLVLDNVSEAMVRRFLAVPDPVAQLAQFDSRVSLHAEWFRDLGRACLEALNADAAATGSGSAPADGDAGGAP